MKTNALATWAVVCLSILATTTFQTPAEDTTPAKSQTHSSTYLGTVTTVNPYERALSVRSGPVGGRKFHVAGDSAVTLSGQPGALTDLRPGQKVLVTYHDSGAMLVADRVAQTPLRREGKVKEISPEGYSVTVDVGSFDQVFTTTGETRVLLPNGNPGRLDTIKPGDKISVIYESRGSSRPLAREITPL